MAYSLFMDLFIINSLFPVVWVYIIQLFINNLRTITSQDVSITFNNRYDVTPRTHSVRTETLLHSFLTLELDGVE